VSTSHQPPPQLYDSFSFVVGVAPNHVACLHQQVQVGIIKDVLGFRQFSLRSLVAVVGERCLVCLAFNLKRLHGLWPA
jgi:hypothetical protein